MGWLDKQRWVCSSHDHTRASGTHTGDLQSNSCNDQCGLSTLCGEVSLENCRAHGRLLLTRLLAGGCLLLLQIEKLVALLDALALVLVLIELFGSFV